MGRSSLTYRVVLQFLTMAGYTAAPKLAQGPFIKYLRSMFAKRYSFGYIIATMPCGVVAGLAPLWEAEGDFDAAWGLNEIYRHAQHVPRLMFYDRGCFRRAWLRNNPDPFWSRCLLKIDRLVAVDGWAVAVWTAETFSTTDTRCFRLFIRL